MNKIDYIIFIPILFGFLVGIFRGFVREITSFLAIILGILGARLMAPLMSGVFEKTFHLSPSSARITAYVFLFIIIALGLHLISIILSKIIHSMRIGAINSLLGGIFGGLKIALIISVFLNLILILEPQVKMMNPNNKKNSILIKPVSKLLPSLWNESKSHSSNEKK